MMEIPVIFNDNPTVQNSLIVDRLLGQGKFNVFQVYCPNRRTKYALKVFPADRNGTMLYRKEKKFSNLSHPNLIERIPITTCNNNDFHVQLAELAKFGDFFNVVQDGLFANNSMIMRTYFQQLLKGVEYMHSQGVAHLDLKLENLMLGNNFQLKIIDFDNSQTLSSKVIISQGSQEYRAPELIDRSCRDFAAADIYSMGVILYVFKTGEFPFSEEQEMMDVNSWGYKFRTDKQKFWSEKSAKFEGADKFFSEEFIELMNGMLERDTCKRWKLEDVKNSRWFKAAIVEDENLKKIMMPKWKEAHAKKEHGASLTSHC